MSNRVCIPWAKLILFGTIIFGVIYVVEYIKSLFFLMLNNIPLYKNISFCIISPTDGNPAVSSLGYYLRNRYEYFRSDPSFLFYYEKKCVIW
jgi:hypothetical protein